MTEIEQIGNMLIEKKYDIAQKMTEDQKEILKYNSEEYLEGIINNRAEVISIIAESLVDANRDSMKEITDKALELSKKAIQLEMQMDEAIKSTSKYRKYIWDKISVFSEEEDISRQAIIKMAQQIDPLIDHAVYIFSTGYVEQHKERLKEAKDSFFELSAPIVPLMDDMAVMPLVGDIDTYRAQVILDTVLNKSTQWKVGTLFIDLSGVTVVDTQVAQEIIKITNSLILLGVKPILTGIRPEIAHTMVQLGITMDVETKATLKQAISDYFTDATQTKL
ncbi:STAS domain-containing protein [Pontibacillus yanchengensis]|uniref:STAS domain-containing protein n=2 Tax=Pontibacillus yanchengensis TaxID=462910 RepID=A0ACC7VET1_9BACI|nr:STAS domain-containing protein [Pontibacillus yanchengensis]MYL32119.1 STAS domain-containing protein [Pontibacillus yanchengensis]MYL52699.1 STAS domain-containing protein [Pontibacillus yanchengensis]